MKLPSIPSRITILASALLVGVTTSHAQTTQFTWNGSDTNFATGANWTGGTAPTTGGPSSINARLDIGTTTVQPANALHYASAQGTTIFAPAGTSGRALVIGSGSTNAIGSMFITGGTFDSQGAAADVLGNASGTGNLIIDGGNYTNVNGGSPVFLVGLNNTTTSGLTANLTITSGNFTTGSLEFGLTDANASRAITGTVHLNGGILETGKITEGAQTTPQGQAFVSSTINLNGGTLRARGDEANFINGDGATAIDNAVVQSGGAIIDSNNFNIGISKALTAGTGSGGLTKNGAGTLTLAASNTYTGDTLVNNGTLALSSTGGLTFVIGADEVNNQITGAGTVNLDGLFTFDLTNASSILGDSWNIVDVGNLTESFTSNFSILDFTPDAGGILWNGSANGADYQFSESSGFLTVIPEPSAALLGALGMLCLLRRRR